MHNRLFRTQSLKLSRYILCAALMMALNGCNPEKQWQLHDITGHLPELRFSLMADNGQLVTDKTYQHYLVLLFFGYTNCQSECPSTLFRLAKIVQKLGNNAPRTRILFVTLDPDHDSPDVLHPYVTAFDPEHMIGLTGEKSAIEDLTKRYRIAFRPKTSEADEITHSAVVYVFDRQGHARLLIAPDDANESVINDLQRLLDSSK